MPHWTGILIVVVLILIFFGGKGRISNIMGDLGKGITSFRKGLKEDLKDLKDDTDAADEAIDITPPKETEKPKTKSKK
ncbi:twin-arginine translocase TatA/TatE family subunit [Robiginitomaculum antarcticum]|uniref:twin-arginine translocase TatA/TatE family subunit n=1 Tax=Robiginitomaculum antarcticum TaxID=437507 RepID=UPI00037E3E52|nr:twin-arginine translocase TatA/TatE family subunit [Robiginitomaculum antarcticum]